MSAKQIPTKSSAEYYHELNRTTKSICNFFKAQNIFFSENFGFSSYYGIRGKNHEEIPDNMPISKKKWPITNEKARDISDAVHKCEKLGRTLFDVKRNDQLTVLSRDFMLEGSTLPIKITYEIRSLKSNKKQKTMTDSLYVKQVNLNRIFLGQLYHLIVGRDYQMHFCESSIVERETKGPNLFESYQKKRLSLSNPKTKKELVKLSIVANFLSLYDMDNGSNSIFDPWGRFDVIDFDKAFWERIPNPEKELINPFAYEMNKDGEGKEIISVPYGKILRHFEKKELAELIKQEKETAYINLKKNLDFFNGIINQMTAINYYNLAAKELYDEKDIVSYFLKKFFELKQND